MKREPDLGSPATGQSLHLGSLKPTHSGFPDLLGLRKSPLKPGPPGSCICLELVASVLNGAWCPASDVSLELQALQRPSRPCTVTFEEQRNEITHKTPICEVDENGAGPLGTQAALGCPSRLRDQ